MFVPDHHDWSREDYNETSHEIVTDPSTMNECEEITFQVKANNQLGDSEAGVIVGGFPKGIIWTYFDTHTHIVHYGLINVQNRRLKL